MWAEAHWRPLPPPRVLVGLALLRSAPGACEGLPPRTAALMLHAVSRLAGMLRPQSPASAPAAEADGLGRMAGPKELRALASGLASAADDETYLLKSVLLKLEGRLEPLVAAALAAFRERPGADPRRAAKHLAQHLALLVHGLFTLHYRPAAAHVEAMAAATAQVAGRFPVGSLMAVARALHLWNVRTACPGIGAARAALAARLAELEQQGRFHSIGPDPAFIHVLRTQRAPLRL